MASLWKNKIKPKKVDILPGFMNSIFVFDGQNPDVHVVRVLVAMAQEQDGWKPFTFNYFVSACGKLFPCGELFLDGKKQIFQKLVELGIISKDVREVYHYTERFVRGIAGFCKTFPAKLA